MLVVNKVDFFFPKNLHGNGFLFPEERIAFVLDHQDGQRDVTGKPAIAIKGCNDSYSLRFDSISIISIPLCKCFLILIT